MKLLIIYFTFLLADISFAQSLQRQSISAMGGTSYHDGFMIEQTVGQSFDTHTKSESSIDYRPGFQQPPSGKISISNQIIEINFFPNPTATKINIETSKIIYNSRIVISDVLGIQIFNQFFTLLKNETINCIDLANGTYIVSITDSNTNLFSGKIIISK